MESLEKEFNELTEKRKEELLEARAKIKAETLARARVIKLRYVLFEWLLHLSGYLIIGFMVSWWLVLGIHLIQFSDFMTSKRMFVQNKKDIWSEIWKL